VPGDRLGALGRAAGEQPGDLADETRLQLQVLVSPALGIPFPAPHPGVLVGKALQLRFFERWFLHQEALPLIPLARPAPPDHHRRQEACLLRPAGERGVAGRQEHQVIHVGTGQAERPGVVHDEQVAGAAAFGARPVPDRLDDDEVSRSGLTLDDALALRGGNAGAYPLRPPGGLLRGIPVREEAQRPPIPGGGDVVDLGSRQAVRFRPLAKVQNQVGEPVVVHRQEVLKVVDAPAPPVFHVAGMQPADADAHVDGGDELLPGKRRRGGQPHSSPEIRGTGHV
jgi:hypothetical protein